MESATQVLHRLTSYAPGREWDEPADDPRVVQDLVVNDVDRLPGFFKRYDEELARVLLPRSLPPTTAPAVDVLAGTSQVPATELDLAQLSRLMHLSAGVVRTTVRPYATWLFRAAGSAGGRFPLELYVSVPEGTGLPAGVHCYDPQAHALVLVGPPPRSGVPTVVVTGVPWRTAWRYRERGFRHVYWDAGTMLAQLLAAAASAGLTAGLRTRFPDAAVAALVGADRRHEWPVAIVALGDGEPALDATGPAAVGAVDASPLELPLVTAAQQSGEVADLGPVWDPGPPVDVQAAPDAGASDPGASDPGASDPGVSDPVEDVVLRRGSSRRMDPTRGLSSGVLRTCLDAALRGIDLPHFVVVHDVTGVAAGVYRWPDLDAAVATGDLREELYRVCLEQGLARDAAFVVIGTADLASLNDRGYREAQLAAGLVEGRLHLLAYAQGASASGMTFLDSEVPALVGAPLDALLFTCVGVPDYAAAAGGQPGAPTDVRMVAPRL